MALKATRPNTGAVNTAPAPAAAAETANTDTPVSRVASQIAAAPAASVPAVQGTQAVGRANAMTDLNAGILENIDGLGNAGNYVTMDGTEFLYKASDSRVKEIDMIVNYGKRYYQWVEEDGDSKIFHDSDTKLDDRYKLKFEIHWEEEAEEGEITEAQFHMPTASAMRFIDYVKALAKAGYGIGQVVTRLTISRQQQKNSSNRYSRTEFTMVGKFDAEGNIVDVANGVTTVGKK